MSRKNIILLALLALQAAFIAFAYKPGEEKAAPEVDIVSTVSVDALMGLTIQDEEGRSITLGKAADGWTTSGEAAYPVDALKITSILNKLRGLKSSRLVARTRSSHARLKVGDDLFLRKITLEEDEGKKQILYLGTSPSHKSIHVRQDGKNEVYLANDLSSWEFMTENDAWWERKYIDIPDAELTSVGLKNDGGEFTLTRGENNAWKIEGGDEALAENAVREFIDKAGHISLTKYEGKEEKEEYGLASPPAVLTLTTKDKTYVVGIGKLDEQNKDHVIKSDQSPFYVRVSTYVVDHLLTKKRDDFIVKPGIVPAEAGPPGAAMPPEGIRPGQVIHSEDLPPGWNPGLPPGAMPPTEPAQPEPVPPQPESIGQPEPEKE